MYVSKKKCCEEKHAYLVLIEVKENRHYVVIKKFNTFMYDHTLHCRKKHFWRYSLQTFSTEEILKCHIKDCFEINSKQKNKMPKTGEYVKFKNYGRKLKSPSIIHGDFEWILVSEDTFMAIY